MFSRILLIKNFFRDPNKKSWLTMLREMWLYGWVKKEWPTDYFRKFLYRKEIKDITSYLSLKEYYSIIDSKKILVPDMAAILENKLSFSLFAECQRWSIPKSISYNINKNFYFNSKVYQVHSNAELMRFFLEVFKETNETALFVKPISGIGGKGCFLLKQDQLEWQIQKIGDLMLSHNYIHQEKIKQHDTVSNIYSHAINTIRINTYLDTQGKCHIISALMRFGSGNMVTDNESSGGFHVALDIEKECLIGTGKESIVYGSTVHTQHPDTKVLLNGYNIPFIKESLELAKQAASMIPTRVIGWDMAITPQGPVIIEGNSNPSLHMADIAFGGLCKLPLVKTILKEIKD